MPTLTAVRLPIDWGSFGFPSPFGVGGTVLAEGSVGWAWDGGVPGFDVPSFPAPEAAPLAGWGLDHVVLMVPDTEAAVGVLTAAGADLRLRVTVRERATAFFRVGTILEVIETGVAAPRLYGVALETTEPLEEVVARWRGAGHDVSAPRPAIQEGRRIFSVRDAGAGFAVMSPRGAHDAGP